MVEFKTLFLTPGLHTNNNVKYTGDARWDVPRYTAQQTPLSLGKKPLVQGMITRRINQGVKICAGQRDYVH
jgi:hypothetical protein